MTPRKTKVRTPDKQGAVRRVVARIWRVVCDVLRWTYRSIMLVVTLLLAILLLASAFSDHISPLVFHYPSYLGIAFPVILVAALLWTVVLLVLRHWWLATALAVALLLAHEPIWRYCPVHIGQRAALTELPDGNGLKTPLRVDTLRVLTYNTNIMGQTHLSRHDEQIPVIDFIRTSGADIVCLQEYAFSLSADGYTEQRIRRLLADVYPHYDFLGYYYRKRWMGIAVFSRFPIRVRERVDSQTNYCASMYYELELPDGRSLTLLNNHLHTNAIKMSDRRLADEMVTHFESDSLQRVRVGLLRQLGRGFKARASQAHLIQRFLDRKASERGSDPRDGLMLVCGDFNDTPISYCYQTLRGGRLYDAWEGAGLGTGITYNRHHFWFRIDHVLHSPLLRPLSAKVLSDVPYSDHYPVMATFQLLPPDVAKRSE